MLYQEELCRLYGVGGTLVTDKPPFLDQLWAFTASSRPSIRLAAWKAFNAYPLHLIGLKLLSAVDLTLPANNLEEKELELAIDQVLAAMTREDDTSVQKAITALLEVEFPLLIFRLTYVYIARRRRRSSTASQTICRRANFWWRNTRNAQFAADP